MREDLIREIDAQGGLSPRYPLPVVSLELFFEDNEEETSIGCNLEKHPGLDIFYDILNFVRRKEEVQDVLVEIYQVEEDFWPYSQRIYIFTSATEEEVARWLEMLEPTEVEEVDIAEQNFSIPDLEQGYKVYSVLWE